MPKQWMSEKEVSKLYSAIHEVVLQKRTAIKQSGRDIHVADEIDLLLVELHGEIWVEVEKALGIT